MRARTLAATAVVAALTAAGLTLPLAGNAAAASTPRFDFNGDGYTDIAVGMPDATVNGKAPKVAIRVAVGEAFLHCAKAFKRSRLWEPENRVDRKTMPSLAKMILEQTAPPAKPPTASEVAAGDEFVEADYKTGMY